MCGQILPGDILCVRSDLSAEKLQSFIPELLSQLFAECLIYGNVTKQVTSLH